ncbi:hypothetical protein V511_12225 [Mesotoga sp. Brook.08.YT.4.2.5.1]|uniref:hypothetical protein n=1 Tax=unclassified Mesotoga TaxID=1184398 RepID=UPI000C18376C|nr:MULTISPECIES: hypothetical protein [unclassified Mesotoga]PNE19884.1 hypothetical protein V511_12225 [Mesotoga sp. Brook.08.YT.4.2.5.1]PVD18219.1 hypothetical protein V512_015240 [Mesotoga sp. Brook.08.105.5.1]RAO96550.1 hypothetical protein M388_14220 [Mesotoga sp. Brook.08.YT.4.2.5.4.]RDI93697.1 hypothetical protein Q502_04405 [Mesotoga sp. Brook.08.YT.4.2.5.2.]
MKKKRAKESGLPEVKIITYELKGTFKKQYYFKRKTIEEHMAVMMADGYAVQSQANDGGEIRMFKTFAKVVAFGGLGLLGNNRSAKKISVTYVKSPEEEISTNPNE